MMKMKFFVMAVLWILFPTFAQAADPLSLTNNTNQDIKFKVQTICSDKVGIIKAHTVHVLSKHEFKDVCSPNHANCFFDAYTTADCSGEPIARFHLNTMFGLNAMMSWDEHYCVQGEDFQLSIDENTDEPLPSVMV